MTASPDMSAAAQAREVPRRDRSSWSRRSEHAQRLVGREAELQSLREHLGEGVLIISGTGSSGIGATALARRLASGAMGQCPDGVIELDLRGADALDPQITEPARFQHRVLRIVAPELESPTNSRALRRAYLSALEARHFLLILDNVASVVQLRALLPRQHMGLIVISQEDISASFPRLHAVKLEGLSSDYARHMAIQIAPDLVDQSPQQIARIVSRVGGLPLAVRVLAPWLAPAGPLSARRMLQALDVAEKRIVALRGAQTPDILVDIAMEVAYDQLDRETRPFFETLAIFTAPFDVDAAAAVWDISADEAANVLDKLGDVALIDRLPGSECFELHYRIRQFAQELFLSQPERSAELVARYAAHYLRETAQANTRRMAERRQRQAHPIDADQHLLWEHLPAAWRRLNGEDPGWPQPAGMDQWIAGFPQHSHPFLKEVLAGSDYRTWLSQALAAAERLGDVAMIDWLHDALDRA